MDTPHRLIVVCAAAVGSLLPVAGLAQAGLSGNSLSGQEEERRGKAGQSFDGSAPLNSQSALGQLEEMTGTTVDRSSSSETLSTPRVTPRRQPAAPRYNPNLEMKRMVATTVTQMALDMVFASLFDDGSAQREAQALAEAEAAARAEELRRQREEARKARILRAQHYRAEWDSREEEVAQRLGGAFETTGNGDVHRNLFGSSNTAPDSAEVAAILGQPAGDAGTVDPTGGDTSVVDLSSVAPGGVPSVSPVALSPGGAPVLGEPSPPAPVDSALAQYLRYFGGELKGYYKGVAISTLKETGWGLLEKVPYQPYAKALVEFDDNRKEYEKKLAELNERLIDLALGRPESLAYAAAAGNAAGTEAYWEQMPLEVRKLTVEYMKLAFGSLTSHAAIDLGKLRPSIDTGAFHSY
jgi:hypothetical protein